jgi:hypothetical protein
MSTMKLITLELDRAVYEQLEAEACRRGVTPPVLAGLYVEAGLRAGPSNETTVGTGHPNPQSAGLIALDRLTKLTADLPRVDALATARESRAELEERPRL